MCHIGLHHIPAQDFVGDGVKQQTGGGIGVIGVLLDQRACRQDGGLVHLFHRDAVVQVAHRLCQDRPRLDVGTQAGAGRLDDAFQARQVEHDALTLVHGMQQGCCGCCSDQLLGTFLRALFPIQNIGTSHFMMTTAHQAQLHLVLHILDVKRAPGRTRAHQGADHTLRQAVDRFTHAGRGGTLCAMHRQKSLHHGNGDLVGLKRHHRAVTADDLVLAQ